MTARRSGNCKEETDGSTDLPIKPEFLILLCPHFINLLLTELALRVKVWDCFYPHGQRWRSSEKSFKHLPPEIQGTVRTPVTCSHLPITINHWNNLHLLHRPEVNVSRSLRNAHYNGTNVWFRVKGSSKNENANAWVSTHDPGNAS